MSIDRAVPRGYTRLACFALRRTSSMFPLKGQIMGSYEIAVLGGDGIGPEVTAEAARALAAAGERFGHSFTTRTALVGQAAIAAEGAAISDETMALCHRVDAVLFGAVGGAGVGSPSSKQ